MMALDDFKEPAVFSLCAGIVALTLIYTPSFMSFIRFNTLLVVTGASVFTGALFGLFNITLGKAFSRTW